MDPWVTKKNALQGHHYSTEQNKFQWSKDKHKESSMKVMLTAFLDHSRPDLCICQESLPFHQEQQRPFNGL